MSYSKCRDIDPGEICSPSSSLVSFTTSTVSLALFRTAHRMQTVEILKTNNSNIGRYHTSMQVFMESALRLSGFNHSRKALRNFIKKIRNTRFHEKFVPCESHCFMRTDGSQVLTAKF